MLVESPVRGNSRAGFGGLPAETERPKGRHRAAGRPYLSQRAVDQVRRGEWNAHDRSHTLKGRWMKGTRWSLLKAPDKQNVVQPALLGEVAHVNKAMFRAFLLKEELRLLYHLKQVAVGDHRGKAERAAIDAGKQRVGGLVDRGDRVQQPAQRVAARGRARELFAQRVQPACECCVRVCGAACAAQQPRTVAAGTRASRASDRCPAPRAAPPSACPTVATTSRR